MPFLLPDVANSFYIGLQESLPTSSTDVTTSRVPIPQFLNILTYVLRQLNEFSPFTQHAVISVTSGTRQYALPSDFYTELSVRYRGFPLAKSNTMDSSFLVSAVTSNPWQYTIFFPASSSNPLTVTGSPYLIVDPAPSETSPAGSPPLFPGINDAYIMVTYQARIPTGYTSANYTTYTFQLPDELAPLLSDLCLAYVMSLEGKNSIYAERFQEVVRKITSMNSFQNSIAENSPNQIQNLWWD